MDERMFDLGNRLSYDRVMNFGAPVTRREFERARFEEAIHRALKKNASGASTLDPAPMRCPKCGKRGDPSARYCDRCGRALARGPQPSPGFTQAVKRALAKDLQAQAKVMARRDGISESEALKRLRLRRKATTTTRSRARETSLGSPANA